MKRLLAVSLCLSLVAVSSHVDAQQRRQAPPGSEVPAANGIPRNAKFPYEGVWMGTRVLPVGAHDLGLEFRVANGVYEGRTLHPTGTTAPHLRLKSTAAGLTWEQPNSGGGTWVFVVRLVSPDSLAGTTELRDAPANLQPGARGTIAMRRVPVSGK